MRWRLFLIAIAIVLSSTEAQSQEQSCADFTLAPDQQIAVCTALLDNSGAAKGMPADRPRYNLFLNRGAAYARSGDSAMAKADFEQAVSLTKEALDRAGRNTGVDYNRSCWAHAVANIELDLAFRHCNEAIRTSRNNPAIHDSRGFLYLRMGRAEDALRDFNVALAYSRSLLASSLYGRGVAKLRLGDVEGAKADLFQAEMVKPGTHVEFTALGFTQ